MRDKLGRRLKDIRVSVTDRCNFRCFFCMPADKDIKFLERKELLTYEEIATVVKILADLGVEKVRITGGEPLVRLHLENLIDLLSKIEGIKDTALTTNGYLLYEKAKVLKEAGLKRITVSLPTLNEEKFKRSAGKDVSLERIIEGIREAKRVGLEPVKVNAVIVKGFNEDEIVDLARFCKREGIILRFIEYMDVGTLNGWDPGKVVFAEEILEVMRKNFDFEEISSSPFETALKYRYRDDGLEFGIIASISRPFCRGCTRLRLSADGKLYTCLFSSEGIDIKTPLRENRDDLKEIIREIWENREDRYSEKRFDLLSRGSTGGKVEMFTVGG